MKTRHLLFVSFATAAMLTSCLSDPILEPDLEGGIPIKVEGSINQLPTKVNAQGFEDGDALGLYAVNYENSNQTPGTLLDKGNQVDHVKYVFDEHNWKWNPVRPVYYKDVNTNVDLYVFYPHAEPSSVSAYNFEVQKDQSTAETNSKLSGYEASDFLWGKSENVEPTEAAIKVKLNHKMAGVHVILEEGTGFEEAGDFALIGKKVMVTGTTRKASINLANGNVSSVGEAQATGIVMAPQSDGSFRAIVVPQTVAAGTKLFNITIEGVNYSFSKVENYEYKSGKLSQFTIKVNRKMPSGEYELVLADTQIIDWKEDINTHEGEARQYYCVHVTEPGTLGQLIKADDKNPDKIKNLKVSGNINSSDFYFMRDNMAILEAVNLKEAKVEGDVIPYGAFQNKKSLYYFTFPEKVTKIQSSAFSQSSLSGALVLPEDIETIESSAFSQTNISSVTFSNNLKTIEGSAFSGCSSLSGQIVLPSTLTYIGSSAFSYCSFSGQLLLPESLEYIGSNAFMYAGNFVGNLTIPPLVKKVESWAFFLDGFTGVLNLNNVIEIGEYAFAASHFTGEVVIPEGVQIIPSACFGSRNSGTYGGNNFSSVILPSTLKKIEEDAFFGCSRLHEISPFPEGMVSIGARAFDSCSQLFSISLPSTLQTIQSDAFKGCYYLSKIKSTAIEPPTIQQGAFNGVAKDNFTVEVPENSVTRYRSDSEWGQFRRISAHHDFSISRPLARALNAQTSKKYILRAPSGYSWSIESKPEWVTVTPSSGTGKTEVTVTFAELSREESGGFESDVTNNQGGWMGSTYHNGRAGEIVFLLNDKDYRSRMTVEQYDYEYGDGDVKTLNTATKGEGVNLVFLADCYDAKDIANGSYLNDVNTAYGYYFDIEPYKTYKDYFNVYVVFGESDDSGMGTLNTIKDSKFGSTFGEKNVVQPDMNECFKYACKAPINNNIANNKLAIFFIRKPPKNII